MQPLTFLELEKYALSGKSNYWEEGYKYRWQYMDYVIAQAVKIGGQKIIEAGASGMPLFKDSFLFDYPEYDLNNIPYKFKDKEFDTFIALQVWEHLEKQSDAFREVMRISKISSKATYHKCLKNLHSLGYINYEPSYNPFKGSHVILFNFSEDLKPLPKSERKPKNEPLIELVSEQALNKSCTSSETGTEQAVVPSINYINNTNILNDKNVSNLEKHTKNFEEINNYSDKIVIPSAVEGTLKEEKSSAKKEEKLEPEIEEVKEPVNNIGASGDPVTGNGQS